MELDKIIPLQETPKTPYQTSIAVPISMDSRPVLSD